MFDETKLVRSPEVEAVWVTEPEPLNYRADARGLMWHIENAPTTLRWTVGPISGEQVMAYLQKVFASTKCPDRSK